MPSTLACPQCSLENIYPDGSNHVCADCGFEWPQAESVAPDDDAEAAVKDANGNVLANGEELSAAAKRSLVMLYAETSSQDILGIRNLSWVMQYLQRLALIHEAHQGDVIPDREDYAA